MSAGKTRKTMFMPLARSLLADRYQRKDKNGKVIETLDQLWRRVARCVAAAEQQYGECAKVSCCESAGQSSLVKG